MAKGAYIGVSDKARKIKKGYIGVDGKARKIKKGYIGVGGVARPCWGEGKLVYFGKISPLKKARCDGNGNYVGNYMIIAGGGTSNSGSYVSSVDAYDKDFVKTEIDDLIQSRRDMSPAGIRDQKALFMGGERGIDNDNSSIGSNYIDIYTDNLVHQYIQTEKSSHLKCSGRTGNSSIFAAGLENDWYSSAVYRIDAELVMTTLQSWVSGNQFGSGSTGNHMIVPRNKGDTGAAWNDDGVRSDLPEYPFNSGDGRSNANMNGTVVFSGGFHGSSTRNVVAYTDDLVIQIWSSLPVSASFHAGASTGEFAIFAGGKTTVGTDNYANLTKAVTGYSMDGVQSILEPLEFNARDIIGAGNNGVAIIAGGYGGNSTVGRPLDDVYAYVVE